MGWKDAPEVSGSPAWAAAPEVTDTRDRRAESRSGVLAGAATLGNVALTGPRAMFNALAPEESSLSSLVTGQKKRTGMLAPVANFLNEMNAAPAEQDRIDGDSNYYKGFKTGTQALMTLPVGGALAQFGRAALPASVQAMPWVANALEAVGTSGMRAGTAGPGFRAGAENLLTRVGGGAVAGGASAGLVEPENAGTGALIGGALPVATKVAGLGGQLIGAGARKVVGDVSPEVAALAKRAKELGIDVPLDRLTNSKPLNAVASSLNYVPLSGRAGTEAKMLGGMNRALSRTFGQDSENVTMALRKAGGDLGQQFDNVLQANTVKMSPAFKAALADAENQATNELGPEAASIIHKQIAQLQTKGAAGEIDGQAAYNIKKALDRIGNGNSDAAFYARDLKKKLMDALNESLGPAEAAAFGKVRQQYGNMLALENLAQNGAEGGVSVGRLANLKHINNPDLQELADIAAQFLRTRESPHGALQRLVIGGAAAGTAGGLGALPMLPVAAGLGRGVNAALNSNALKNAALGAQGQPNALQRLLANSDLAQLGYRAAPTALSAR